MDKIKIYREGIIRGIWDIIIIAWIIVGIGWVLNILAWNAIPSPYLILDNEAAFYEALERNAFYNEMTGYVFCFLVYYFPWIGLIWIIFNGMAWKRLTRE